jgi:hypothetical protein
MNWLKADLEQAKANRATQPWIIFGTHHPLYCSYLGYIHSDPCFTDVKFLRPDLEDLLNEYSVDMFFNGHVHNYERDGPVYKGAVIPSEHDAPHYHFNAEAPVYITVGSGGNREGMAATNENPPDYSKF